MNRILDGINSPEDIKKLNYSQLNELCKEIRSYICETVNKNSGHLASNLGIVEMTLAIHRVFKAPEDKIIFDVGHQCYVHKIITGRREAFKTLREKDGISGFTKRSESEYDVYGAGHSGTSLSAAIGFASAQSIKKSGAYTVCVIGDGAYTDGIIHEALNNVDPNSRLIILLNENEMSISKNVGNMAKSLSRLRSSRKYLNFKHKTEYIVEKIPLIGKPVAEGLRKTKNLIKRLIYHTNYFEDLGICYLGPCDGNNLENLEILLKEAKRKNKCCIIHAKTVKGMGYEPAVKNPEKYHSVSNNSSKKASLSEKLCEALCDYAEKDKRICVTTAAMGMGTGMKKFSEIYADRFFDVGIAEEHAVTFCAGLAADGMLPVFAVYSTFLQRTYDYIWHEFSLQKLPFVMLIDRAGLACEDGATHHGIFDVPMLYEFDNTEIFAPYFQEDAASALAYALYSDKISAIRYSKDGYNDEYIDSLEKYSEHLYVTKGKTEKDIIVTYGRLLSEAMEYRAENHDVTVVLLTKIKPLDELESYLNKEGVSGARLVFAEESIYNGGAFMVFCSQKMFNAKILAIKGTLPEQADLKALYKMCKISKYDMEAAFKSMK